MSEQPCMCDTPITEMGNANCVSCGKPLDGWQQFNQNWPGNEPSKKVWKDPTVPEAREDQVEEAREGLLSMLEDLNNDDT